jgi:hypothetical protein
MAALVPEKIRLVADKSKEFGAYKIRLKEREENIPLQYTRKFERAVRSLKRKQRFYDYPSRTTWLKVKPDVISLDFNLDLGDPLTEKFERLAKVWEEETLYSSSSLEIAMHPAYQQIIGMGPAVVPLLLRALQKEPAHWFWALSAITGENPISAKHRGKVEEIARVWIAWGQARGYI